MCHSIDHFRVFCYLLDSCVVAATVQARGTSILLGEPVDQASSSSYTKKSKEERAVIPQKNPIKKCFSSLGLLISKYCSFGGNPETLSMHSKVLLVVVSILQYAVELILV